MTSFTRKLPAIARILLGLVFFVFGLNGFLHFLPQPPVSGNAGIFLGGLLATGYFFPLLKGVEVLTGALLLANRFVPLSLAVLAPIVVNIVAFHAVLAPSGMPVAILVLALEVYLAWAYRAAYRPMLQGQVAPSAAAAPDAARPVGQYSANASST
jgi:uncharacterized membrane protein YphA (DoxX/SURF4 family)